MAFRILALVCGLMILWRCFVSWPSLAFGLAGHTTLEQKHVVGVELSDEPGAILVDHSGRRQWTVSIPHNASFPLRPDQYKDICRQGDGLRNKLRGESRSFGLKDWRRRQSYYAHDRTFLDVAEAEQSDALPRPQQAAADDVCSTSLTFALETEDASFGNTLLMMWLSYGLAKREGRAFFIDDTRWPYGKYTSYFAPPPSQGCSPPPAHQVIPCPHQAKHLSVSAATAPWTFGPLFQEEFTQQRKQGAEKHRQVYELIRTGFQDLFKLVGEDASYAQSRIATLKEEAASHGGSVVGMQVRRGDLHPLEYQYSRDYLPLERYASGARLLFRDLLTVNVPSQAASGLGDFSAVLEYVHSPLLLASDDPDIFESAELSQAAAPFKIQKAQERILLATKATLDESSPVAPIREPGSAYVKHVDENSGWEGGFYSALFYSLGSSKASSGNGSGEDGVSEQAMRIRELVGRAYLLDLAVLGESNGVVCAASSAGCRILGVMLGWDAVVDGRWVNVDDGRVWSWDGRR